MKVAVYCRVSTDKDDQINSFESQQRFFRQYIGQQPGWELYEVYADGGITGTNTKNRAAFNRMIQDARLGRFHLIITKEISRFARNVLDSIYYTRQLKQQGVGVFFLNDNINTLKEDSEMLLAIKSTMAQEESRSTSSRVKWGQTRRMEQGVVFGRSMLGYDVNDGKMTVNPQGAAIVRLIFHKYVHEGKGTTVIARELREAGYKTLTGSLNWRSTVLLKILRNEKYCGDLKQKKTFTPDYLTHQKKYNHGEEAFIFIRDHHEPVVGRELWEEAQREIARRNLNGSSKTGHGNRYPLSGKIQCSVCGKCFVSRTRKRKDGSSYQVWRCGTAVAEGRRHPDAGDNLVGCDVGYQIRDDIGMEMVRRSVNMLPVDNGAVIDDITHIVLDAIQDSQNSDRRTIEKLEKERTQLEEKKKGVLDAFFTKSISEDDMKLMNAEYDRRMEELAERITQLKENEGRSTDSAVLDSLIRCKVEEIVNGKTAADRFYGHLLDHLLAYPDRRVEVHLKGLPTKWTYVLENRRGSNTVRRAISKDSSRRNPSKSALATSAGFLSIAVKSYRVKEG